MQQVPRADQIELADAIAEGARRRPNQAFGEYFSTKGGWCAPGAADEGAYALPQEAASIRAARSPVRLPRERPPPLPRRVPDALTRHVAGRRLRRSCRRSNCRAR